MSHIIGHVGGYPEYQELYGLFAKKYQSIFKTPLEFDCEAMYNKCVNFKVNKHVSTGGICKIENYLKGFSMSCKDHIIHNKINFDEWYIISDLFVNADSLIIVTGIKIVDYEAALSERGLKNYTTQDLLDIF